MCSRPKRKITFELFAKPIFWFLVDGNWSPWSEYGECTKDEKGKCKKSRDRECNNPKPEKAKEGEKDEKDGKYCTGTTSEGEICDAKECGQGEKWDGAPNNIKISEQRHSGMCYGSFNCETVLVNPQCEQIWQKFATLETF